MNTLIITQTGIDEAAAAAGMGINVVLSTFKLGDAFGYNPTGSEVALHGTVVYTAPVSSYSNLPDGSLILDLTMDLDSNLGFGEIGIFTSAGKLFAIGSLPKLLQKSGISGDLAATYTFRCLLKLSQLPATFTVSSTGFDVVKPPMYYVNNWTGVLPPASMPDPDIRTIVVITPDSKGDVTTLVQTGSLSTATWSIQTNYFNMGTGITMLASTANYCEISQASWQNMVPGVLADTLAAALGYSFVIQTATNYFRQATVALNGSNIRFTYTDVMSVVPTLSQTIEVWTNDSLRLGKAVEIDLTNAINAEVTNRTVAVSSLSTSVSSNLSTETANRISGDSTLSTALSTETGLRISGDSTLSTAISDIVVGTVGQVAFFATSTAPFGWLKANGAAMSRTTYTNLFSAIGTTYGAGNGSTTFNIPDLRNRMSIGSDSLYSLGITGGSTDAVVVSHNHTLSDPTHSHAVLSEDSIKLGTMPGSTAGQRQISNGDLGGRANFYSASASSTGISLASAGVSGTNANLPPYIALLACIKY